MKGVDLIMSFGNFADVKDGFVPVDESFLTKKKRGLYFEDLVIWLGNRVE